MRGSRACCSTACGYEPLAELAGVSPRSIAGLFARELGVTPHEFVGGMSLDQARSLLESSDTALKAVSFDCGFASPDQMRSAFQRRLNVTPQQYRASFRKT